MNPPFKKKPSLDLTKLHSQQEFVQGAKDAPSLLHKELSVNKAEQELLLKRIELMKSTQNDLPSYDPQYSMMQIQLQMDQIELDELKRRAERLTEQLKKLSQS